jgi:hypothetical protein
VPHALFLSQKRNIRPDGGAVTLFQINWALNCLLVEILGWALDCCEVISTQLGKNP